MESQLGCKKSLTPPYQQSFRIDDLLTRKVIEQQPDHYPHLPPTHHTPLQPPPSGPGMSGARLEKSSPSAADFTSISGAVGNGVLCHANGKSGPDLGSDNSSEAESKTPTKRSYSSTSNEDEDEMYRNKRKKARTAFSREQVADLEKKFQEKKYLSSAERGELAERLKLSDMQVKTWFQNRRMKFKRQSEEAEMEMKSPKYPYGSFMPYGGMGSFYSYVPMPYKSGHDGAGGVPYTYNATTPTSALRSPQTTSPLAAGSGGSNVGGMDANFVMNSPTMLGSLSSPLSAGVSPRLSGISATGIPRPNPTSSYFNGLLTPISPSTGGYQHNYFTNEVTAAGAAAATGSLTGHIQGFTEWPRTVPAPTTP